MVDNFKGSNRNADANGKFGKSINPDTEIMLVQDEQGRAISCYVEKSMEIAQVEYALLLPMDTPIEIFAWEEDDQGEETLIDLDEDELSRVFLTARAVLAEQELTLAEAALTLTAQGDVPIASEDDIVTIDLSDEEGRLESEDFQLLASFFYEGQEYAIYTPLNPLLIFVRLDQDRRPTLLEPEEFELIRPQVEDLLFDEL